MDDPTFDPPNHPGLTCPENAGWSHEPEHGFLDLVGPVYARQDGAARRFGFRAQPKHANLIGIVQGGMIMTFADRGLGVMAWEAAGQTCVTISFETQFVGAGRIGAWLELEGDVVRRTADLVFLRGRVMDGGRVVASCQGIWKRVSVRGFPEKSRSGAARDQTAP